MIDELPALNFVPPSALGRGASLLFDVALLGLAPGAFLVGLRAHAHRLERARAREHAQLREHAPLQAGTYAVLEGNIDSRDAVAPIQVTVTEPHSPVAPSGFHAAMRQVIARPFDLETAAGRVRVEPGYDPLVAAALESEQHTSAARVRRAELEHGNRIIAYGTLSRERHAFAGYRGGADGWTLRAPGGHRMLLADAALTTRYDERIRVLRRFTRFALPLWLAFHAIYTLPFLVGSFTGTQTRTELLDWEPMGPVLDEDRRHDWIQTRTAEGLTLEARIPEATGRKLRERRVTQIPLLHSAWKSACYVGGEAWTSTTAVGFGLSLSVFALAMLRARYRRATPWYDRR